MSLQSKWVNGKWVAQRWQKSLLVIIINANDFHGAYINWKALKLIEHDIDEIFIEYLFNSGRM